MSAMNGSVNVALSGILFCKLGRRMATLSFRRQLSSSLPNSTPSLDEPLSEENSCSSPELSPTKACCKNATRKQEIQFNFKLNNVTTFSII